VHSSKKTPEQVVKVACLGDSNTTGEDSYPTRLKKILAVKHKTLQLCRPRLGTCARCEVQGFGYRGAKAAADKMQYCRQAIFRNALAWQAHIYIIMLGTNDAHQSKGQPKHVEKALEALVAKIRRDASHARVFFHFASRCQLKTLHADHAKHCASWCPQAGKEIEGRCGGCSPLAVLFLQTGSHSPEPGRCDKNRLLSSGCGFGNVPTCKIKAVLKRRSGVQTIKRWGWWHCCRRRR